MDLDRFSLTVLQSCTNTDFGSDRLDRSTRVSRSGRLLCLWVGRQFLRGIFSVGPSKDFSLLSKRPIIRNYPTTIRTGGHRNREARILPCYRFPDERECPSNTFIFLYCLHIRETIHSIPDVHGNSVLIIILLTTEISSTRSKRVENKSPEGTTLRSFVVSDPKGPLVFSSPCY